MYIYEAPVFLRQDDPFYPECYPGGNTTSLPQNGKAILWETDLGLFGGLEKPLYDKEQFDLLEKRLEKFLDETAGKHRSDTLGILLFSGSLEEILQFPWDSRQQDNFQSWSREVDPRGSRSEKDLKRHYAFHLLNEFLELLTSAMPDQIDWFARVDASEIADPLDFYQLSNTARFDHLHIFWKAPCSSCVADLIWENGTPLQGFYARTGMERTPFESLSVGWCLPPAWALDAEALNGQKAAVEFLEKMQIRHRPVPQEKISLYWQGLDILFAFSGQVSRPVYRQLAGFCAAGGTVVTDGELLGLPNELGFDTFCSQYVKA